MLASIPLSPLIAARMKHCFKTILVPILILAMLTTLAHAREYPLRDAA
jgi:hypothetical protein